jgi:hypothetical protein
MDKLIHGWSIPSLWEYILVAIGVQACIRLFMSMLSAIEPWHQKEEKYWDLFRRYIIGCHPNDDAWNPRSDYLLPLILGILETLTYPVLLATGSWTVIGAWIGFKTIAQFNLWKENRSSFNRFLIGNALVVISAYLFLVPYVFVTVKMGN